MAESFKPGDAVSWAHGSDVLSGTVSRVTGNAVYVVEDNAKLLNGVESGAADALHFEPGGFVGHTSGTQRYHYRPGTGPELAFTARRALGGSFKERGTSSRGSMRGWGILFHGRSKHRDYNF